jgi:hypothetical protein
LPLLGRDASRAKQLVAASWQLHAGLIHIVVSLNG